MGSKAREINSEQIVRDVVVIGASAGGIPAVTQLLSDLPADLPAILGVVIHRGAHAQANWAELLGRNSMLCAVEPHTGTVLENGFVYVARADHHMRFRGKSVAVDRRVKEHYTRPAVDPLFRSAAKVYGSRVLGMVLTGGGSDGVEGLRSITAVGGVSLVQKPDEAEHKHMPENALRYDHVRAALSLAQLASAIIALAHGRAFTWPPDG